MPFFLLLFAADCGGAKGPMRVVPPPEADIPCLWVGGSATFQGTFVCPEGAANPISGVCAWTISNTDPSMRVSPSYVERPDDSSGPETFTALGISPGRSSVLATPLSCTDPDPNDAIDWCQPFTIGPIDVKNSCP